MTAHRTASAGRRLTRSADDRGSMAMLLMVSVVGLMLSALLVPLIITQSQSTRFATSRVQALDAARAGIDAALGRIRTAFDPETGLGDSADLPCGPISGDVNSSGAGAYTVTIEYFTSTPSSPSAQLMLCVGGYGAFEPSSGVATPSYARLTSIGTVGPAVNGSTKGRELVSTYIFRTTNTNIPGGKIQLNAGSAQLCWDAGSATPFEGADVVLRTCSTTSPPEERQVFVYRSDLTIQLRSSATTARPNGLCVETATVTSTTPLKLQLCKAIGVPNSPPYTQQWSYNDDGRYQGSNVDSKSTGTLSTLCLGVATPAAEQAIVLATCGAAQSWLPSSTVGPGAAAEPQLVNYFEFGRCLDVDGAQLTATTNLISYPCKQNPNAGKVLWNQKFARTLPTATQGTAVGQIITTPSPGNNYCLTTAASGGYVRVRTCGSTPPALQQWTVASGHKSLSYSEKFTIVDNKGLCLGLTVPMAPSPWSTIVVEPCTGATEQKWNADPNLSAPTLENTREK